MTQLSSLKEYNNNNIKEAKHLTLSCHCIHAIIKFKVKDKTVHGWKTFITTSNSMITPTSKSTNNFHINIVDSIEKNNWFSTF